MNKNPMATVTLISLASDMSASADGAAWGLEPDEELELKPDEDLELEFPVLTKTKMRSISAPDGAQAPSRLQAHPSHCLSDWLQAHTSHQGCLCDIYYNRNPSYNRSKPHDHDDHNIPLSMTGDACTQTYYSIRGPSFYPNQEPAHQPNAKKRRVILSSDEDDSV